MENNFKHSIAIPVPLGEKVYTYWTKCCDACTLQHRHGQVISCQRTAPCHTRKWSVEPVVLSYDNLKEVLQHWGVFYFFTSAEAENAGNARVLANIKTMRDLGYAVDDDGTARHIMKEAEARKYNAEKYGHESPTLDYTSKTFKQGFLDGDFSTEHLNAFIEYWHTHEGQDSLREFLGMTEDEYAAWAVRSDNALHKILGKL